MNINDVLAQADGMKTNMMPRQMKIGFIEELDQKIYHELVLTHMPQEPHEEACFLNNMIQMIRDELKLQNLHAKEDVVRFIDTLRGEIHRELLWKQARMSKRMFTLLEQLEALTNKQIREKDEHTKDQLIAFLQELISVIDQSIPKDQKMPEYDRESDEGTELLLPERFKMVYVYWIMTRIDQYNQETEKENNNRARFENEYEQMSDWWTRTHRPIPARPFFRI